MALGITQFNDAQTHANNIGNWQQTYDQVSAGRFKSQILQLNLGDMHVYREFFNKRVVQQGITPSHMLHFAIPISTDGSSSLQGCQLGEDTISVLNGQQDFMFHAAAEIDYVQVSMSDSELQQHLPGLASQLSQRNRQPILQINHATLDKVRKQACHILKQLQEQPDMLEFEGTKKLVKHQFISLLLELLQDAEPYNHRNITHATYSDIVSRSQSLVLEIADEPVTVLDLCRQLRISRRTLQNSFQHITNASPVEYLRAIRLNRVRQMLLNKPGFSIREVAGHWGFYHLGHFANDYRQLFEELPSVTRARVLS